MELTHNHSNDTGDLDFKAARDHMQATFERNLKRFDRQSLFRVNASNLYQAYLSGFVTGADRQQHRCQTCHSFISRFGGLVFIDEEGRPVSAFWDPVDAPVGYQAAFANLQQTVQSRPVQSVFFSTKSEWGTSVKGDWYHFAVSAPRRAINQKANAWNSRSVQAFGSLTRYLGDKTLTDLRKAVVMLQSGALNRAESYLEWAKWLVSIYQNLQRTDISYQMRRNLVWQKIGVHLNSTWIYPASSVLGALLDDIAKGKSDAAIIRTHNLYVDPLNHMRPKAAPTQGNIDQANQLFVELGIPSEALKRRLAEPEEVLTHAYWKPATNAPAPVAQGAFDHLRTADPVSTTPMARNLQAISWVKFARDVLPGAISIKAELRDMELIGGITAPVIEGDYKLFKWDHLYAHFFFADPIDTRAIGLSPRQAVPVTGIVPLPLYWGKPDCQRYMLMLEDTQVETIPSLALFPTDMRHELMGVRKSIEKASSMGALENQGRNKAMGLSLTMTPNAIPLQVTDQYGTTRWIIDRFE